MQKNISFNFSIWLIKNNYILFLKTMELLQTLTEKSKNHITGVAL